MKLGRQLNIRMDDSLLSRLKLLADANYSTPSQVARRAIADAVDRVQLQWTKRETPPSECQPQPTGS